MYYIHLNIIITISNAQKKISHITIQTCNSSQRALHALYDYLRSQRIQPLHVVHIQRDWETCKSNGA